VSVDRRTWLALAALIALHLGVNLVWLARTTSVDIGLPHNHLYQALAHAEGIEGARTWGNPDSPLYALSDLTVALLGRSYLAVTLPQTLLFFAALLGVFLLARAMAGPGAGIVAAALASFTPALFGMSRLYSDLPFGVALTAWCLWLLWRGRAALWPWPVAAALALLGARAFFVPSNGPLVWLTLVGPALAAWLVFWRDRPTARRGLLALTLLGATLAAYLVFTGALDPAYYVAESGRFAAASLLDHPHFALSQFVLLGGYILGPLLAVAFVVGTFLAVRGRPEGRWFLLLAVLIPLVVLTIVPKRKDLNLFALLPAIAVLTAVGLAQLRRVRLWVAPLLVAALALFCWQSFTPREPAHLIRALDLEAALEAPPYPWADAPHADPPAHRVARAIVAALPPDETGLVYSLDCVSDDTLRFELAVLAPGVRLRQACEEENAPPPPEADLLLTPGNLGPPPGWEPFENLGFYLLSKPASAG
jgi:4-amino-4-deoxy-L-arabinose transferase-like glycosyltransferase